MKTSTQTPSNYEEHVGQSRQYWRDIILGVNDGLVSMLLLVAGVVGGNLTVSQVLLTAVAGAVAGAISMGAGEYLATKSQEEVLSAELALERSHIQTHRGMEMEQLRGMLAAMGLESGDVGTVAAALGRTDATLLETMKALEFGIVDNQRRSPFKAMWVSGVTFIGGSLPSVVPFLFVDTPGRGLLWAAVLAGIALYGVGVAKTRVTKTSPVKAGAENLAIAGFGGGLAFLVGRLVDRALL